MLAAQIDPATPHFAYEGYMEIIKGDPEDIARTDSLGKLLLLILKNQRKPGTTDSDSWMAYTPHMLLKAIVMDRSSNFPFKDLKAFSHRRKGLKEDLYLRLWQHLLDNGEILLNYGHWTPLHSAMVTGNPNVVEFLLTKAKVDPNPRSGNFTNHSPGLTPLLIAIQARDANLMRMLLEAGADPNLPDMYGRSPLRLTTALNYFELAKLLVEYGARCDVPAVSRETVQPVGKPKLPTWVPSHQASLLAFPQPPVGPAIARGIDPDILSGIFKGGADPSQSFTPLQLATSMGQTELALTIVENFGGCDTSTDDVLLSPHDSSRLTDRARARQASLNRRRSETKTLSREKVDEPVKVEIVSPAEGEVVVGSVAMVFKLYNAPPGTTAHLYLNGRLAASTDKHELSVVMETHEMHHYVMRVLLKDSENWLMPVEGYREFDCRPNEIAASFSVVNDNLRAEKISREEYHEATGYRAMDAHEEFNIDFCDVDRVDAHELSVFDFIRNYFQPSRPVIITGTTTGWRAYDRWRRHDMAKHYGGIGVTHAGIPHANVYGVRGGSKMSSLAEYLDYMQNNTDDQPSYVFDIAMVPSTPPLQADFTMWDAFVMLGFNIMRHKFFIGGRGSGAPVHHHCDATNTIVYGKKRWILFPPAQSYITSEHPFDFVRSDAYANLTNQDKPLECIQNAGEMIYIPAHWGHAVLNLEDTIGIAMEIDSMLCGM